MSEAIERVIEAARFAYCELAAGRGMIRCLDSDVAVVFQIVMPGLTAGSLFVGVFDDAGELDYTAWLAQGQDVVSYEDLNPESGDRCLDPLDCLSIEERNTLEDRLWAARSGTLAP